MPNGHEAAKGEVSQQTSLYHSEYLQDDKKAVAVEPVCKNPRHGGCEKGRSLADESDETEDKGRAAQAVDKPTHCYLLHPGTYQRKSLAPEEKSVVSVAKSPQNESQCLFCFTQRCYLFVLCKQVRSPSHNEWASDH